MKNLHTNYRICVLLILLGSIARASEFVEPPVFISDPATKTLDLLMVAKPTSIDELAGVSGWAYEICEPQYTNSFGDGCQLGKANSNPYGGARLQLSPGDTLKVRLVNRLPINKQAKHQYHNPDESFLGQNPTNLHTHGMLVPPNQPRADMAQPVFGDSVFVLGFNSANGVPDLTPTSHTHGLVRTDFIDYQIPIPANHPSGLFWFHPHAHGISLNQVSAGLSGIITIGQVKDYIPNLPKNLKVRHIILKDTQVNSKKLLINQEDPALCDNATYSPGICHANNGSQWFFTLSGQLNPTFTVASAGEIWRITNASASNIYDLQLAKNNATSVTVMPLQVLSVDGISVGLHSGSNKSVTTSMGATKFHTIPCPGVSSLNPSVICADRLHMMPSSRTDVWVVNRNSAGNIIQADGSEAILQTAGYSTGPSGDDWPAIDLAQVKFSGGTEIMTPALNVVSSKLDFNLIAQQLADANARVSSDASCMPLPVGWKRRIFFGYPQSTNFGLGFELVNEKGQIVPQSYQSVIGFPHAKKTICLPLGNGNTPVNEKWEIVNLTAEDHNFHIHQTKFRVLTQDEVTGVGSGVSPKGILQDNVPLLAGDSGCDGTVANWRKGNCHSAPVKVEIPFAIAGDFVFHCHILEHEDGGMMAAIRVVSANR